MENSLSVPANEHCAACYSGIVENDVYCTHCGYPLKGTEMEQKTFIVQRENVDIDLAAFNKKIKTAGNSLYYLSGVFVLSGIIIFFISKDSESVVALVLPNLILAILFLILGAFSRQKPLACLVSGLCLYVIVQVLNIIDNPVNIASGIVFKIIIIGYLIKGIKSAIEIEKIKKENNIA